MSFGSPVPAGPDYDTKGFDRQHLTGPFGGETRMITYATSPVKQARIDDTNFDITGETSLPLVLNPLWPQSLSVRIFPNMNTSPDLGSLALGVQADNFFHAKNRECELLGRALGPKIDQPTSRHVRSASPVASAI